MGTPPEGAPAVLLVTIDTLRADRLGAYGHASARTPNLDALAERGVRFEQVITPGRFTGPAHASILTGLLPEDHGALWNGWRLASEVPTLADALGSRGWVTGAFVSGWTTRDRSCGLPSRFQEYDEDFLRDRIVPESLEWVTPFSLFLRWRARSGVDLKPVRRSAEDVTDRAVRWLDRNGDRPFFVWVHYFDPHLPYEPPDRYRSDAARRYRGVATGRWYDLNKAERSELVRDPESVRQMGRLYDAAIAAVDDALGRLLATALERAPGGRLLTVVVADHGESMGEHALWWGRDLYDATLRVPLILESVPTDPALRSVVSEQVRVIDVAPTVLELLGLEPSGPLDGLSAVPLMRGEQAVQPTTALSRMRPGRPEHIAPAYAVRGDGWKLIRRLEGWNGRFHAGESTELYDLHSDPGELEDVSGSHASLVARMRQAIDPLPESEVDPAAELPEEAREQLRRLGYLD